MSVLATLSENPFSAARGMIGPLQRDQHAQGSLAESLTRNVSQAISTATDTPVAENGNGASITLANVGEVVARVRQEELQLFDMLFPVGSAENDDSPRSDQLLGGLESLDAETSADMQALLKMMEHFDGKAADAMRRSFGRIVEHLGSIVGGGGHEFNVAPPPSMQVRSQRIEIAIQASVTEISGRLESGESLTATEVEVSIRARVEEILSVSDPLVLDLNGNGVFDTTTADEGHDFDLLGDGSLVRAATASQGDALLVYDRNGNGNIDDGTELFGDQNGAADGFVELAKYDENGDGRIDQADSIYGSLGLFADVNRNGITDEGELRRLDEAGIAQISLSATAVEEDSNGNKVVLESEFVRSDGSTGRVGDLLLNYIA
ncbi:hypothetical protein Pan216_27850 [Planctomycetes bacterium Pan216]|uniref:Uncharacterized protein n=1 Tax=Kolteria novifilia TaxID=2527975 RepID=A0A518B4K8_9BACT|nr:hypothetical protein Pan216_27850 [Planctomycetes bacterium Pan216]